MVLQTDNTVLYERLEKRRAAARRVRTRTARVRLLTHLPSFYLASCSGYSAKKITENIDCEIFGVVLEEATESYTAEGAVRAMSSDSLEDMERNADAIRAWLAEHGVPARK